jgi:hypothetical protein
MTARPPDGKSPAARRGRSISWPACVDKPLNKIVVAFARQAMLLEPLVGVVLDWNEP